MAMTSLEFISAMASKLFSQPKQVVVTIVDPANSDKLITKEYHPLVWAKLSKAYKKGFDVIQVREVY